MIDQLEQDCIIASEAGFAAASGRTGMFTAMCDQADDRVKPEWRCPNCGESLDIVTCETCGIHYEIEVTPPVVEVDEDAAWYEDQRAEKGMIEETF